MVRSRTRCGCQARQGIRVEAGVLHRSLLILIGRRARSSLRSDGRSFALGTEGCW